MSNWKTIKIREETYRELLKLAGILQIKWEEKIGIDEVITVLIGSVPKMKILIEEIKKEGEKNKGDDEKR